MKDSRPFYYWNCLATPYAASPSDLCPIFSFSPEHLFFCFPVQTHAASVPLFLYILSVVEKSNSFIVFNFEFCWHILFVRFFFHCYIIYIQYYCCYPHSRYVFLTNCVLAFVCVTSLSQTTTLLIILRSSLKD